MNGSGKVIPPQILFLQQQGKFAILIEGKSCFKEYIWQLYKSEQKRGEAQSRFQQSKLPFSLAGHRERVLTGFHWCSLLLLLGEDSTSQKFLAEKLANLAYALLQSLQLHKNSLQLTQCLVYRFCPCIKPSMTHLFLNMCGPYVNSFDIAMPFRCQIVRVEQSTSRLGDSATDPSKC